MEPEKDKYMGGCIFVDLATGYLNVEFQPNLTTHETLIGVDKYERMCRELGVIVQGYLSDNGSAFTSAEFQAHLQEFKQIMRFAGAGAHHSNGAAERAIRTVMNITRAILFHQSIHWPEMSQPDLWPMAVQHAVYLYNHIPHERTGVSPHDLFTRTRWPHSKFQDLHVWGCPLYALDHNLANGMSIPRFKPRSQRLINMGHSPRHASTIPLALNPETGYMKAIFHCFHDDFFSTVSSTEDQIPDFNSPEWSQMFGDSVYQYPDEDEADEDSGNAPSQLAVDREARVRQIVDADDPDPLPVPLPPTAPNNNLDWPGLLPEPSSPRELFNPRELSNRRELSLKREPYGLAQSPSDWADSTNREWQQLGERQQQDWQQQQQTNMHNWREQVGSKIDDDDAFAKLPPPPSCPASCKTPPSHHSDDHDDSQSPQGISSPTPHQPTPPTTSLSASGSRPQREERPSGSQRGSMVLDVDYAPEPPRTSRPEPEAAAPRPSPSITKLPEPTGTYWKPVTGKRVRKQREFLNPSANTSPLEISPSQFQKKSTLSGWLLAPACYLAGLFADWGLMKPYVFASSAKNNPDIFTFDECINSPEPDRTEWMESMLSPRKTVFLEGNGA